MNLSKSSSPKIDKRLPSGKNRKKTPRPFATRNRDNKEKAMTSNVPSVGWYKNALSHAPGVGGIFGLVMTIGQTSSLMELVGVIVELTVIWWIYKNLQSVNAIEFLKRKRGSGAGIVSVSFFGLLLSGDYFVALIGWWITHGNMGIAVTGLPMLFGGIALTSMTYRKAKLTFS